MASASEETGSPSPTDQPGSGGDLATTDGSGGEDSRSAKKPPDKRMALAVKAKDDLIARLSGRLGEVLKGQGAAAAINVCSREALSLAEQVGRENGVQIGRTSFKLRNTANAPRDWAKPLLADRVDTPQHVGLDDGSLGVLFPIRLDVKCLMCHGGADDILDEVSTELTKLYPEDAATGFKQGDLRGWVWVEVPPSDGEIHP